MKKFFTAAALTVAVSFILSLTASAQDYFNDYEYTENWKIQKFHSEIIIQKNGTVDITERIVADFSNEAHRGIARVIPYKYQISGQWHPKTYNARLDFKSAVDENGNPWKLNVYKDYGYLNIEMTNHEDEYRNDINNYIINYTADNVISFFENHEEFYWNVNGTEWVVPIDKVSARVHLPDKFDKSEIKLDCFTGTYGSTEKECSYKIEDSKTVSFESLRPFKPYENLTIVIGLPKGSIPPPSPAKKAWWFIRDNWGIIPAPITLIVMLYLWYTRGRDEKIARDTIMPHYKPPKDLKPTETGTIIDEKIHPRDITATIIDFAIKGYIKINEIEKKKLFGKSYDYELVLKKPYKTSKEFEKITLEGIFPSNTKGEKIKISKLKNKFYKNISNIKKKVMKQLIQDNFFPHNPSTIRKIYIGAGITLIFISFQIIAFSVALFLGLLLSGITISIVGNFLPRKTKKGTETYYKLRGLYEYIETAEKDRMKFQEEQNILFEKLLPYAISFGLVKKWANAFKGIITRPPTWYHPAHPYTVTRPFRMTAFANSLNSFSNKTTSSLVSRPGGRGGGGAWTGVSGFSGGFSGGGFGGGGGRGL
ncbi:DUF2207 domain-containing protein [Candidatus Peregrinibacteria bacterium]|nr:DUF2207 domain-containing protein [Candidatus Peregrinibacteria bacterium]